MSNLMSQPRFLKPKWPAPNGVKAFVTTRQGGNSLPPFESFNLATHVGDNLQTVIQNRSLLQVALDLPSAPCWLEQQHTTKSLYLNSETSLKPSEIADASWTDHQGVVSVVMTADCLPILVTNRKGNLVSSIHAGWRGLADGVVETAIAQLPEASHNLLVWIGPAIGANAFEVGQDVLDAFCLKRPYFATFFRPNLTRPGHFWADLVGLAKAILSELGVTAIYGGEACTFTMAEAFYSYRREGQTGRMASLIWMMPV